jgi:hypothetical protein
MAIDGRAISSTSNGTKPHDRYDTFLTISGGSGNSSEPEVHLQMHKVDGSEFAQAWFRVADLWAVPDDIASTLFRALVWSGDAIGTEEREAAWAWLDERNPQWGEWRG